MTEKRQVEAVTLWYVPDTVRKEFVNIGVVLVELGEQADRFAGVRFTNHWGRVRCLDPHADVELVQAQAREIGHQLAAGGDAELRRKLEESLSTGIQLSQPTYMQVEEPAQELEELARLSFGEVPATRKVKLLGSGRQRIVHQMRNAFESEGVLDLMMKEIAVSPYTGAGDPLKLDFGYRVGGEIKLFHAVSLKKSVEQAFALASRYPKIREGIKKDGLESRLTAVVDEYDVAKPEGGFAVGALREQAVSVATMGEVDEIARRAKVELMA